MTTKMITVVVDDTLSHAANLLRQFQIYHLPVVRQVHRTDMSEREKTEQGEQGIHKKLLILEGLLTSQDIDLVVAMDRQRSSGDLLNCPWFSKRVAEVMHRASIRVTPTTSAGAAAQILVERGFNCLPVVEYEQVEGGYEPQTVLIGLLTRSDLLSALARAMGIFEPGMQLIIPLPLGDMTPLAQTLLMAAEMQVQVHSLIVAPQNSEPRVATLRLGTINPSPLLVRLQAAHIVYTFAEPLLEGDSHV